MDTDHAAEAQRAAEEHLAACWEALDAEQEGNDEVEWPEGQARPVCGCQTCEVREVLAAAYPHLLSLAREELSTPAA